MSGNWSKARAQRLGYPADLLTPIVRTKPMGLLEQGLDGDAVKDEFLRRINLLMSHYGVDDKEEVWNADEACKRYLDLVFSLAMDWVPGFNILDEPPRRKGAPTKNTIAEDDNLVEAIDRIIVRRTRLGHSKRECSIIEACRVFRGSNEAGARWKHVTPQAIKNRYTLAKKSYELRRRYRESLRSLPRLFGLKPAIGTVPTIYETVRALPDKDDKANK